MLTGAIEKGRLVLRDEHGNEHVPSAAEKERDAARFAEMLRTRRVPGTKGTDRTFFEGWNGYHDGLEAWERDAAYRKARESGVSTAGKHYVHGLAKYPGDPAGWVSDTGEVLAKCRQSNASVEGAVNYQAPEGRPHQAVRLNPRIVAEEMRSRLEADPELRMHPERWDEERDRIVQQHGGACEDMGNVAGVK